MTLLVWSGAARDPQPRVRPQLDGPRRIVDGDRHQLKATLTDAQLTVMIRR